MSYYNKSGVMFLTLSTLREIVRGKNSANCQPPEESTPYPTNRKKGDVNAKIPSPT
jgi:hypothetical protein